ncbi:hypothetical protein CBOM_06218 [Ceraceosorus bombacis]|uniref:Uncharacterized protein n=1 Tax=Ceraceosorus bombacis TaxID=401625 RepID=A0A0P1BKY3_9BASI|nr:hypothetical protein CBOM_06218 [Ceraceosorus bombacis]
MTGTNQHMTKLEDIATNIDGTTQTSFSWTCPEVEPYSAIYFYQFTDSDGANPTWCTRFTIASADGSTVPPPNDKQPEGDSIPWGEGKLVNGASSPDSSGGNASAGGNSNSSSQTRSSGSSSSSSGSSTTSSSRPTSSSASSNSNTSGNTTSNSNTSGGSSGASSIRPIASSAVALVSVLMGAAILL